MIMTKNLQLSYRTNIRNITKEQLEKWKFDLQRINLCRRYASQGYEVFIQ